MTSPARSILQYAQINYGRDSVTRLMLQELATKLAEEEARVIRDGDTGLRDYRAVVEYEEQLIELRAVVGLDAKASHTTLVEHIRKLKETTK